MAIGRSSGSTIFLLGITLLACQGGHPAASPPMAGKLDTPPSIVVITIDTLRADHLHAYGYHRETSPASTRWRPKGFFSSAPSRPWRRRCRRTCSLFSGVYAHQHGVAENRWRRAPFAESDGEGGLRSVAPIVPRRRLHHGSVRERGSGQARDRHGCRLRPVRGAARLREKGSPTTDQAIAWLERAPREPFLLWVHLWDPHEPNRPSDEWATKFASDDGLDAVIDQRGIDPERLARAFAVPALRRFLAPRSGERDEPHRSSIARRCATCSIATTPTSPSPITR